MLSISRSEAEPQTALAQDLSVAGIRFEVVGCEIELAEVLTVRFQRHEERVIRAMGRVGWCTEIDAVTQEVGLEFLEVPLDCAVLLRESTQAGEGEPT